MERLARLDTWVLCPVTGAEGGGPGGPGLEPGERLRPGQQPLLRVHFSRSLLSSLRVEGQRRDPSGDEMWAGLSGANTRG